MSSLTTKRAVVGLALAGALVLVAAASRPWVTGTVDDPVLGASRVAGSGRELAPGVVAVALAAGAAAVAAATTGRVVRRMAVVVLAAAGLGATVLVLWVLLDPARRLGGAAARATGRTGTVETHAAASAWPWVALAAAVALVLAGVAAWVGSGRWSGLSPRYEAPSPGSAPSAAAGDGILSATRTPGRTGPRGNADVGGASRGQRVASAWDTLDAGRDPTVEEDEPPLPRPLPSPPPGSGHEG